VSYVQGIPVKDANGDELTVYEFQDRRFLTKVRRLKLDSGELVEPVCENSFVVVATGEKLVRVDIEPLLVGRRSTAG
jgi:hypothetical protein